MGSGALQRKAVESSRGSPFGRRRGERRRTGVHPWPGGLCLSIWEAEIVALRGGVSGSNLRAVS